LTEQGVPLAERVAFLSPRVYNGMASNLAKPQTSGLPQTMTAFEKAYLGNVAGFETYKNDQSIRLAAASGGATTVNGANQYWWVIWPSATSCRRSALSDHLNGLLRLRVETFSCLPLPILVRFHALVYLVSALSYGA